MLVTNQSFCICVFIFIHNYCAQLLLGIEDISHKSDLATVLVKVEEKFRLDLTGNLK